jgi:hypothetical protein
MADTVVTGHVQLAEVVMSRLSGRGAIHLCRLHSILPTPLVTQIANEFSPFCFLFFLNLLLTYSHRHCLISALAPRLG